jgi:cytochrome P450
LREGSHFLFVACYHRKSLTGNSDTTAATLTHLFYRLATTPELMTNLRNELDPVVNEEQLFEHKNVQSLLYLNGLINEVLRFHAPIPSGLQRVVPAEGITVDGRFIPGYTLIRTPA